MKTEEIKKLGFMNREYTENFIRDYSINLLDLIKNPFLDRWQFQQVALPPREEEDTFLMIRHSVSFSPNDFHEKVEEEMNNRNFEEIMYDLLELNNLERLLEAIAFSSIIYNSEEFIFLNRFDRQDLSGTINIAQGARWQKLRVKSLFEKLPKGWEMEMFPTYYGTPTAFQRTESASSSQRCITIPSVSSEYFDGTNTLVTDKEFSTPIDREIFSSCFNPLGLLEVTHGENPHLPKENLGWIRWQDKIDPPSPPKIVFQWGIHFRFRPIK